MVRPVATKVADVVPVNQAVVVAGVLGAVVVFVLGSLAFLVYRNRERAKEVFLSFVSVEAILVAEVSGTVRPLNASRRREGMYQVQDRLLPTSWTCVCRYAGTCGMRSATLSSCTCAVLALYLRNLRDAEQQVHNSEGAK